MEGDKADLLSVKNNEDKIKLQGDQPCPSLRVGLEQRACATNSVKLADRVANLKEYIRGNIYGCDFLICIFTAALKSYKSESCLRPFPQSFINKNNEKDFLALRLVCYKIPPLKEFLALPPAQCSIDVVNLLHWLFIEAGLPTLRLCPSDEVPLINSYERSDSNPPPRYVFEVTSNDKVNKNWIDKANNSGTFYAFHGSLVENFYSILKIGLQQHFSTKKEVLFGNGVYLSSELLVCTNYAPFRETWKNSMLGEKHSIIALCEVINDAEEVKCQDKNNKMRALNENSLDTIPEKYYVITNSELVKIKYLLVYRNQQPSFVKSFIKKNFLWIVIVMYVIMLLLVGFVNGPHWPKVLRFFGSCLKK